MPRDAHPHHLRHARAPYVADCRAPQVMELEIGNRRRFAGVLSRFAEIPDRAADPHEDWLEVLAGNTVGVQVPLSAPKQIDLLDPDENPGFSS